MKFIHALAFSVLSSLTVSTGVAVATQQSSMKPTPNQTAGMQSLSTSKENQVDRGRYLVEELARCADCHTPRDSKGALDRSQWLQGAAIWITPVQSKEAWAMRAPSLVGFPYSDQQAQGILERGLGTNGNPIQPPMHSYHLHHEDALAIIAYLRSLSHAK